MLWDGGDTRPHSIRFDIVTCPPMGKDKLPSIFYRAVSYDREAAVMFQSFFVFFLSFLFFLVSFSSFSFLSFLPISTSLLLFSFSCH